MLLLDSSCGGCAEHCTAHQQLQPQAESTALLACLAAHGSSTETCHNPITGGADHPEAPVWPTLWMRGMIGSRRRCICRGWIRPPSTRASGHGRAGCAGGCAGTRRRRAVAEPWSW